MKNWNYGDEEDSDTFREAGSREEAIAKGKELAKTLEQDYFYIAESGPPDWSFSASEVLDSIADTAPECWFDNVTKEQLEELHGLLASPIEEWLKKHKLLSWHSLQNMEKVSVHDPAKGVPCE